MMEKKKDISDISVVDNIKTTTTTRNLYRAISDGGDVPDSPRSSGPTKTSTVLTSLNTFLNPYEPLIMTMQSLLVWEYPWKSCILFAFVHILFWFVSTTSSRFFFLLSVFIMAAVFIDTWKNRIWKATEESSKCQEDGYCWTPVHPRLMSVPELSSHLSKLWESLIQTLNWLRKARVSYPLVFCLGNTAFFTLTAMIGYYVSGFMLIYIFTLNLMLWPMVSYNSLMKKGHSKIQPIYTRLGCLIKGKVLFVITLDGRLSIPPFIINAVSYIFSKTPSEDEDFMPQGDHEVVFGKAITDSEEDTPNSGIPTPRMSKAPSFNNMLDDNHEDANDFDLHLSQMPSFDDLDNTDDELEMSSMTPHKDKSVDLQFTPRHFGEEQTELHISHRNESQDVDQTSMILGLAKTALATPQTGALVAQTISSMMESALHSALGQGQSTSSSSVIPCSGATMTYTRSEEGESIDFRNTEPTIDEEEEDYEAASRSDQIAEIENSFDFLDEFDPNTPDDF